MQALETVRSEHAVVAEALDAQEASVGLEADRFDLLEVAPQLADSEVAGVVDGGLGAQGAPELEVLLDAGLLVVEMQRGLHAGREHARAEARGRALGEAPPEQQLHEPGPPAVEVLADDLLEELAPLRLGKSPIQSLTGMRSPAHSPQYKR